MNPSQGNLLRQEINQWREGAVERDVVQCCELKEKVAISICPKLSP